MRRLGVFVIGFASSVCALVLHRQRLVGAHILLPAKVARDNSRSRSLNRPARCTSLAASNIIWP
jgi:hypothetical protein